jgi:hypothetical protein
MPVAQLRVLNSRHILDGNEIVIDATLISEDYRRMQAELHGAGRYGVAGSQYAPLVAEIMQRIGTRELLDYGAGNGGLGRALEQMYDEPFVIHHYDPAVPQWAPPPAPCRFVTCIDVLEHIEPDFIENVLDDLARVTAGVALITVDTRPARKVLSDGRNAHLIQQPARWWLPKLLHRFDLVKFERFDGDFLVIVERRGH